MRRWTNQNKYVALSRESVWFTSYEVAAIPTVADALDRRARRNAGIDLMDQAQKFDFARDTIAGRESSAWEKGKSG